MVNFRIFWIPVLTSVLVGCFGQSADVPDQSRAAPANVLPRATDDAVAVLGQQLYFDTSLSLNRNQSCASCHDPGKGFVDPRDNGVAGAFSLGSDGVSLGDRNAPTAAYAALTPGFHLTSDGQYRGGQFHDGRANSLADQAGGPPTNPIEMGLADSKTVVERIRENPSYVAVFTELFGDGVFATTESAYSAMTNSIMAFEQTALFMPFDSKYDRYLRGEAQFTEQEELGKTLFFSQQFTNCNQCHQLSSSPFFAKETFTNYEYRNIGVPSNIGAREVSGMALSHQDLGLYENPLVDDPAQQGKFKVPTLRNVAVTGPYMHNGVFKDLRTVVLFYDKYNNPRRTINPESNLPWGAPEVSNALDMETLTKGPALNDKRIDALVAFLKTLTDQRYESQLN